MILFSGLGQMNQVLNCAQNLSPEDGWREINEIQHQLADDITHGYTMTNKNGELLFEQPKANGHVLNCAQIPVLEDDWYEINETQHLDELWLEFYKKICSKSQNPPWSA